MKRRALRELEVGQVSRINALTSKALLLPSIIRRADIILIFFANMSSRKDDGLQTDVCPVCP